MRICLILEGCYPYIFGGVSTWMHQYINEMKEHEFVLWVIGANAKDKGKFVYELPKNVVEVHEVFLDDALRLKDSGKMLHAFTEEETNSLKELMLCRRPNWEILFRLYHDAERQVPPAGRVYRVGKQRPDADQPPGVLPSGCVPLWKSTEPHPCDREAAPADEGCHPDLRAGRPDLRSVRRSWYYHPCGGRIRLSGGRHRSDGCIL